MKRRVPIVILVFVALAAVLLAVRARRLSEKNHAPLIAAVPTTVRTAEVQLGTAAQTVHVLGHVRSDDEVMVSPRIMADILDVSVREGAQVTKGQIIARLDARELEDAVASAEASVAAARVAAQTQRDATARDQALFEAGAISQEQYDRSRAADAAAEARQVAAEKGLDRARTHQSYTVLRAPTDGTISKRLADPGNLAMPGKPILRIASHGMVRIEAKLPSETLPLVRVGQPVILTIGSSRVESTIARFSPALGADHLLPIEVDILAPPEDLVSGATVGIDVQLATSQGLRVPVSALLIGENQTHVFRVTENSDEGSKIDVVAVEVLSLGAENAVVSGNLASGQHVVSARSSRLMTLSQDMPVRVATPDRAS